MTVHVVVLGLAVLAVTFAAQYPAHSSASPSFRAPDYSFSGLGGSTQGRPSTYLRAGTSNETLDTITSYVARADTVNVRAAGGVSPTASFSSGVSAAAATSGLRGAGVKPLADVLDPKTPYEQYQTQAGDTVSGVAAKFGITLTTLLINNPHIEDKNLIQLGQLLLVPRKDGILVKVRSGDTVSSLVKQYDNVTVDTVVAYKPNNIADASSLEVGLYVLLPGATFKPPPPPPPKPVAAPSGPISGGGVAPPRSGGRFSSPLAAYHGVSDPFGSYRGGGTYHTGIDLDLYGFHHSNVFSACNGVVVATEYLTYSYGYHVIVDCGDGWTTLYAHLDQINVTPGQRVNAGTTVGISGLTGNTTGEHLHFEIRYQGAYVNPADYLPF
jgi:murein DD-endopeptidase MepM/ murein hydrolase activator NlpD